MKQKVVTKAIIKKDGRVLLLRRNGGRPSIDGLFELPGGRVSRNQQPEDALEHVLKTHLGVGVESDQMVDVMTYIDPDDRELQYTFIVYDVALDPSNSKITLSEEYDKHEWKKLSDIQLKEVTQSTQQILGLQLPLFSEEEHKEVLEESDDKKTSSLHLLGYSDGGSRGNPGPAASGFVLLDESSHVVREGGEYLGIATNNVAEYNALYLALKEALLLGASSLDMKLDSLLVVNQMNGIYRIKNADLIPIHERIKELSAKFERVTFSHVMREYNSLADGMVNKILDEHATA